MIKLMLHSLALQFLLAGVVAAYCSEPSSEPWCLSNDETFQDRNEFESCRWEVEHFMDDVSDYVDCLSDEQEEQIERANNVIRRFNCGAESGETCW